MQPELKHNVQAKTPLVMLLLLLLLLLLKK